MIDSNAQKSYLLVPAHLAFSTLVRNTSESLFKYLGMSNKEVFRLKLVVDELFMNAVRHGSDEKSSVHITYIFKKNESVNVSIEDEGTGKKCSSQDLKRKMAIEFQRHNPEKTSGRGLAQISLNFTDQFEIEESQYGGIKVSFTKNLTSIS